MLSSLQKNRSTWKTKMHQLQVVIINSQIPQRISGCILTAVMHLFGLAYVFLNSIIKQNSSVKQKSANWWAISKAKVPRELEEKEFERKKKKRGGWRSCLFSGFLTTRFLIIKQEFLCNCCAAGNFCMAWIARSPAPASTARAALSGDLSESTVIIDIIYHTDKEMSKLASDACRQQNQPKKEAAAR